MNYEELPYCIKAYLEEVSKDSNHLLSPKDIFHFPRHNDIKWVYKSWMVEGWGGSFLFGLVLEKYQKTSTPLLNSWENDFLKALQKQYPENINTKEDNLTMKNIKQILEGVYSNPSLRKSIVPLFLGNPGIGKTVIIRDFAKEKGVKVIEFITSQMSPFEISGIAIKLN